MPEPGQLSLPKAAFESPWQNGIAEHWMESCRRDLLDHIIALASVMRSMLVIIVLEIE